MKCFRILSISLLIVSACSSIGCKNSSGGSGGSSGGTRVRFMNVITEQEVVQMFINEESQPRMTLNYGEMSEYTDLGSERFELRLLGASSPVPIHTDNITINNDSTILFIGPKTLPQNQNRPYQITTKKFEDLHIPFVDNRFLVRVVNVSPTTERFDVYVLRPGVPIEQVVPRDKGVNFGSVTQYTEGNESPAYVDLINIRSRDSIYQSDVIDFDQNPVVTIYLFDQFGRGLPLRSIVSIDSDY